MYYNIQFKVIIQVYNSYISIDGYLKKKKLKSVLNINIRLKQIKTLFDSTYDLEVTRRN